jgi:hypothetical protein
MKFKVGDLVRCTVNLSQILCGPLSNEHFVVKSIKPVIGQSSASYIGFTLGRYLGPDDIRQGLAAFWHTDSFELVATAGNFDTKTLIPYGTVGELMDRADSVYINKLVRQANDGRRALEELFKICRNDIEFSAEGQRWKQYKLIMKNMSYRIKPKEIMKPWIASESGWTIESLSSQTVSIGCLMFNKSMLLKGLIELLEKNLNETTRATDSSDEYYLQATKKGVQFKEHVLAWSDAERLLKELKK